jgi:hypothetical protein
MQYEFQQSSAFAAPALSHAPDLVQSGQPQE